MDAPLPSGEQFEIVAGDYRAVAVEAGGGLRTLTHAGRDLIEGYPPDALADGGRGQVLAPWPNRVRDGKWTWQGEDLQLALSEPKNSNASHGLVRWAGWGATERSSDRVVLTHRLHPQSGYPFTLDLAITYTVDAEDGLTVELVATNPGPGPAPVALGMHPYLAPPGGGLVDGCTLQVPARTRVVVDERSIPVGTEAVEGTPYDLRSARLLGDLAWTRPSPTWSRTGRAAYGFSSRRRMGRGPSSGRRDRPTGSRCSPATPCRRPGAGGGSRWSP